MNVLIWGFDNYDKAFHNLDNNKTINITTWIGRKENSQYCDIEIKDLFNNSFIENLPKFARPSLDIDLYKEIYDEYYCKFQNMYSRTIDGEFKNYHENLDKFNIFLSYFYSVIINKKIEVAFFSSLPHFGPELIIYAICQKLNIKTIMLYQSLFENKFFLTYTLDDFGTFEHIKNKDNIHLEVENKFEKKLFYMNKLPKKKSYLRKLLSELLQVSLGKKRENLNYSIAFSKYNKSVNYYYNNNKYSKNKVDLEKDFIYFPLHLQPELSTSALGDIYSDQLLAIEHLRKVLPDDCFIYVKENPKQDFRERNRSFYKRLSLINNVVLVNSKYNTHELIKKSKAVSLITGTAGWESVCGGKPVLVFGNAWYKSLTGVFEFDKNIDIEKILNYQINFDDLQNDFNQLIDKSRIGVIDKDYEVICNNYNQIENNDAIKEFILDEVSLLREEIK